MPEATPPSPDLSRGVSQQARTWVLYPPEHPAVQSSIDRTSERIRAIRTQKDSPAFINLIGLFPVGTQVRLNTDEGDFKHAAVEAVDPDSVQLDPLTLL